jgi:hypothetical protein
MIFLIKPAGCSVATTYAFEERYVKRSRIARARRVSPVGKEKHLNDLIVRRRGQLIEAEIDGELIGLAVEQGTCFGFNPTATRIWSMIETPRRFGELRDALVAEFDVDPETCGDELAALLRELEQDGLVELEPVDG